MDGSVYATGFRSDVAATLIGRERKERHGSRVDELTRPMNEPPWSSRTDNIRCVCFLYLQIRIHKVVVWVRNCRD